MDNKQKRDAPKTTSPKNKFALLVELGKNKVHQIKMEQLFFAGPRTNWTALLTNKLYNNLLNSYLTWEMKAPFIKHLNVRNVAMEVSERNQGIFFIFINRWTDHEHTFTFLLSWFQFEPGTESCKLNDINTEESKILIQDWSTLRFTICCWHQLSYAKKVPYGRFFTCLVSAAYYEPRT